MSADLKSFCKQQMKTKKHYQPWFILALIAHAGSADWDELSEDYEQYENDLPKTHQKPHEKKAKERFRTAIRKVLQEKHGVAQLEGNRVRLTALYSKSDIEEIRQSCLDAIQQIGLPAPRFVPAGLPSLGKKR